jgi:hypothetical protein
LAAGPKRYPEAFLFFFYFSVSFSFLIENFEFKKCIDLNDFNSAKICKISQRVFCTELTFRTEHIKRKEFWRGKNNGSHESLELNSK